MERSREGFFRDSFRPMAPGTARTHCVFVEAQFFCFAFFYAAVWLFASAKDFAREMGIVWRGREGFVQGSFQAHGARQVQNAVFFCSVRFFVCFAFLRRSLAVSFSLGFRA